MRDYASSKWKTQHELDQHSSTSQLSDNVISMEKARIKRTEYEDTVPAAKKYQ